MELPAAGGDPAFEERVLVGVEEGAVAGWDAHPTRASAVVHHAEEREEMRPRAVALVHGVRVERLVGA